MAQAVPARPLRKRLLLGSVVLHVGSRPLLKWNILPIVATPFAAAAVSGQALSLSSARTSRVSAPTLSLSLSVCKKEKKDLRHSLSRGCNIEDVQRRDEMRTLPRVPPHHSCLMACRLGLACIPDRPLLPTFPPSRWESRSSALPLFHWISRDCSFLGVLRELMQGVKVAC